jgi:hypothetical protein
MYHWQQQQLCKQLGLMNVFKCAVVALQLRKCVEVMM